MGGCTSKPKVLKDDSTAAAEVPEPAPETVEEKKEEIITGNDATVLLLKEEGDNEKVETTVVPPAVEEKEEVETTVAPPVTEDKEEVHGEAVASSNQDQEVKSVTDEKLVAIDEAVDQIKEMNEEGKDSTQSDTITAAANPPEVQINEGEEAQSESILTSHPETGETEKINPALEGEKAVETSEKKPEEQAEIQEEKKKEEAAAKPQPENNPIASFFSSLMGQKR